MAGDQGLASGNSYWGSNLTAAVLNGTIPQWRLDDMVVRIMSVSKDDADYFLPVWIYHFLNDHLGSKVFYRKSAKIT